MSGYRSRQVLLGLLCVVSWPALASQVPIHDCDRLAGDPHDVEKVVEGIGWDSLDADKAVSACEIAVHDNPGASASSTSLRGLC